MTTGTLRTQLNSVAHKRAREVARPKRIAKPKTGVAIKSEFRSTATRIGA
jgi:hypothetical protein